MLPVDSVFLLLALTGSLPLMHSGCLCVCVLVGLVVKPPVRMMGCTAGGSLTGKSAFNTDSCRSLGERLHQKVKSPVVSVVTNKL